MKSIRPFAAIWPAWASTGQPSLAWAGLVRTPFCRGNNAKIVHFPRNHKITQSQSRCVLHVHVCNPYNSTPNCSRDVAKSQLPTNFTVQMRYYHWLKFQLLEQKIILETNKGGVQTKRAGWVY